MKPVTVNCQDGEVAAGLCSHIRGVFRGDAARQSSRPSKLRSFDPNRIADLEYRAWVGYYLRRWPQVLVASVRLVRSGFGMDWVRTLHGAWLVLRANQLWAPMPDNDPDGARRCMRRFYRLVRLSYGHPADPAGVRSYAALLAAVHHAP